MCANQHQFHVQDGVLSLLTDEFRQRLGTFLAGFEPLRQAEGRRLTDTAVYPLLPCAPPLQTNHEWRLRCYDLEVIHQLLTARPNQHVLEIGAWNGWLSYHLTLAGHEVTAVDYFTDEYDGLRAKKHYPADWQTIQINLTDLSVLDCQFELVILNRCLPFFADPVAYALAAREKVAPGGLLVLTGLAFFQDASAKAASVAANRRHLQANGLDYFTPMKGYLDFTDREKLQATGMTLRPYPQLWRANLKARFQKSAPRYEYALLDKDGAGSP
jgi:SAM-dependent methyltransferase